MIKTMVPPVATRIPHEIVIHADHRKDDYYWLRDLKDPRTLKYLKAENAYTESVVKKNKPLQTKIFKEIKNRIKETDSTVPAKRGLYFYYSRTEKGKAYRIYCRKKGSPSAKEEILLDANRLAKGKSFFALGAFDVSEDHQWLAYSVDTTGAESFTIHFKNLKTKKIISEKIPNVSYGVEWSNDGKFIYYATRDEAFRPYRILRHKLGTLVKHDEILFEEKDQAFSVGVGKTLDKKFIVIATGSSTTSEAYIIRANEPNAKPVLFAPRKKEIEYSVDHGGDYFYVRTNEGAKNFKVMRAPDNDFSPSKWKELIPHQLSVHISDISCFKDRIVIQKREGGLKKISILNLKTNHSHDISFPEPTYDLGEDRNFEFDTPYYRMEYSSLVTPDTVFDYDIEKKKLIKRKTMDVLGGYDADQYKTERLFAKASDGTSIPISIVYRKDLQKNGKNPTLLEGYGAYGIPLEASFSPDRLSLLDRGFVYAIAHIRGGGELGETWHDDGKLLKKQNSFADFISIAEFLVSEKFTSSKNLVISGGSAGGLLMGGVLNARPDLFYGAILQVPFVDLLNTMSDASLPLTVGEYEEWGNPADPEFYRYMKSYSPYDNIKAQGYPNMLVIGGLNDTRVSYWEPAKWVAKLRATKTDKNLLLLKTNMKAGHGGASGRYDEMKETAFNYTFVLSLFEK